MKDVGEVKAVADWEEMDRSVYNAIIMCTGKHVIMHTGKHIINHLQNTRTSHQAWQKLEGKFQANGITRIIEIRRKLLHAVLTKEEDIEDWLDQMSTWHKELVGIRCFLQEDEFSLALLMVLLESWDSFTNSFNLKTDLSYPDAVMSRIREQAARVNSHISMIASQGKGKDCYKRGKEGHIKWDCPQKTKGGKGKGKEQEREKEKDRKSLSRSKVAMVAKELDLDSDSKYACTATDQLEEITLSMLNADSWIGDTGTTVHVAQEHKSFTNYTFTPVKTLQGAGSTPILGRGTVKL